MVGTIKGAMNKMGICDWKEWKASIAWVLYGYHHRPLISGALPFELLYGVSPRMDASKTTATTMNGKDAWDFEPLAISSAGAARELKQVELHRTDVLSAPLELLVSSSRWNYIGLTSESSIFTLRFWYWLRMALLLAKPPSAPCSCHSSSDHSASYGCITLARAWSSQASLQETDIRELLGEVYQENTLFRVREIGISTTPPKIIVVNFVLCWTTLSPA